MEESERRIHKRIRFDSTVEFTVDNDSLKAISSNISSGGIQLFTDKPITVSMKIEADNVQQTYKAQLVWARRNDEGKTGYGFEFIYDSDSDETQEPPELDDLQ